MKFGLLFEIEVLYPWDENSHSRIYWESIEQAKAAEEAGFDVVWCVEHHFLNQFSISSAPEVFLAAVAQHTEKIRIGHGVVLLPFNYNHPVRVAERAATLDILSRGRLEFGTGRSATLVELDGFGIDPDAGRHQWDEAVRMIPKMWTQDEFSWESELIRVPPRNVVPKPVQKPHPPMWMAGTQPSSAVLAGERGLGFLHFSFTDPEGLDEKVRTYREAVSRAKPVGLFVNNQFAAFTGVFCGENDARAREIGGPEMLWYVAKNNEIYTVWLDTSAETYRWYREHFNESIKTKPDELDLDELICTNAVCIGSPETCRRIVGHYADQGVDQLIMIMQVGRMPHKEILGSIHRFGAEVIPYFRRSGQDITAKAEFGPTYSSIDVPDRP